MIDEDCDKKLTYDEFVKLVESEEDELVINAIKAADKDGSGFLTASELKELLLKTDPTTKDTDDMDSKVAMLIKMTSVGGDNKLKIEEVIKMFTGDKETKKPKQTMGDMFRMYDVDGDGFISKKELAKFMKISEDYDDENADFGTKLMVEMIMMMVDQDEDGKLNYEEFCKIEQK